jgi:HK97 family phage prohead protease
MDVIDELDRERVLAEIIATKCRLTSVGIRSAMLLARTRLASVCRAVGQDADRTPAHLDAIAPLIQHTMRRHEAELSCPAVHEAYLHRSAQSVHHRHHSKESVSCLRRIKGSLEGLGVEVSQGTEIPGTDFHKVYPQYTARGLDSSGTPEESQHGLIKEALKARIKEVMQDTRSSAHVDCPHEAWIKSHTRRSASFTVHHVHHPSSTKAHLRRVKGALAALDGIHSVTQGHLPLKDEEYELVNPDDALDRYTRPPDQPKVLLGRVVKDARGHLKYTDPAGGRRAVDLEQMTATFILTTDSVDRVGDRVMPDGVDLSNLSRNCPVFFGHQAHPLPIGKMCDDYGTLSIVKQPHRLIGTVYFSRTNDFAKQVFQLVCEGSLSAVSIGFEPSMSDPPRRNEFGGYDYPAWELLEASVVGVPANADCTILYQ